MDEDDEFWGLLIVLLTVYMAARGITWVTHAL